MEFLGEVCQGDLNSPRALIAAVANGGMDLVEADRCSFYLKDNDSGDLWSLSGGTDGDVQHFPLDAGILGFVATRGETINVTDAGNDPRFDKSHDLRSGYETKTLLCMPLADASGNLVAVIQFLNKLDDGVFQKRDEDTIRRMAGILGPLVAAMPHGAPKGDSISM